MDNRDAKEAMREALRVDFNVPILDVKGKTIRRSPTETAELTLGDVAIQALVGPGLDESKVTPKDKLKRWKLAQSILAEGDTDREYAVLNVALEQRTLLLQRICEVYGTTVYGRAHEMLHLEEGDE